MVIGGVADAHQKEATLSNGGGGAAWKKNTAEAGTRTAEAPRKPRRKEKRGVAWGEVRAGLPQGAVQRLLLIQTQREADKEYYEEEEGESSVGECPLPELEERAESE